jgi:hypothetical protein
LDAVTATPTHTATLVRKIAMTNDFYDDVSKDTLSRYKRMQVYIDLAIKQGDVIYQEKPYELTIKIRKEKKPDAVD